MKYIHIILLFLITSTQLSNAQNIVDVTNNINNVKRDTMYIYAEATMKDFQEASKGAHAILEVKVGEWVRSKYPNEGIEVCIVKAKEHCLQLETRRGDYYRAFVYVRKSDIMPIEDSCEIELFDITKKDNKDAIDTVSIMSEDADYNVVDSELTTLSTDEEKMKGVKSFYDVEPFIKSLKNNGKLKNYGKYATMPLDEDCYLFVYDKQGNISAILRKSGPNQYNLNSLIIDNVKNYKNCGAIWFQLK